MRRLREVGLGAIALVLMLLAACASKPQELERAEEVYQQAARGEAQQDAPAALRDAQEAFKKAENAYEENGNTEHTRALAYVAIRKAQLAMAEADINQLTAAREQKKQSLMERTERARKRGQEQLKEQEHQQELTDQQQEYQQELTLQEMRQKQRELEETRERLERRRQQGELADEEFRRRQRELEKQNEELRKTIDRRAAAEDEKTRQQATGQQQTRQQPEGQTEGQEGDAPVPADQEARAKGEAAGQNLEGKLQELADIALLESVETGVELQMDSSDLFEADETSLTAAGMNRIDRIASVLESQSYASITVVAYPSADMMKGDEQQQPTAEQQEEPAEQQQSMRRAEAVRQYLIKQGIPSAKIETKEAAASEAMGHRRAETAGQIGLVIQKQKE